MTNRTPAQYAADRRRSHKAKAKREQRNSAFYFEMAQRYPGQFMGVHMVSARMARRHLNFVLTGEYADFV